MCGWAVHGECLAIALMMVSLDQRELNLRVVELFDVITTSLDGGHLLDLDDLLREEEDFKIKFQ